MTDALIKTGIWPIETISMPAKESHIDPNGADESTWTISIPIGPAPDSSADLENSVVLGAVRAEDAKTLISFMEMSLDYQAVERAKGNEYSIADLVYELFPDEGTRHYLNAWEEDGARHLIATLKARSAEVAGSAAREPTGRESGLQEEGGPKPTDAPKAKDVASSVDAMIEHLEWLDADKNAHPEKYCSDWDCLLELGDDEECQ